MTYRLRLFITGRTSHSVRALENLQKICDIDLKGHYELEVIDVLEDPERADMDKILATPTLVRRLPEPMRKVIGDLSDRDKVLMGLDIFNSDVERTTD